MFRCGFYEKEITPPLGCCIPGYFTRREASGVKTKLYAKAVAIEANEKTVVMIAVDAENLPECIYKKAVSIIKELTGIDERYVMINATHTHTGGPVENPDAPYETKYFTPDREYISMLGRLVGDCGVLAVQRLEPMTAKFAQADIHGVAFVRNYIMKDGNIRTNPGFQHPDIVRPVTEIDPSFPIFYFFDESGRARGMISNFSAHHDCVRGDEPDISYKYNADYSGVLADEMKKEFGNDFVSLFINGTCGDINYIDVSKTKEEMYSVHPHIRTGMKLAEAAKALCAKAEPFEIDCVDGIKENVDMERREISEETVAELKELIEVLPFEGLRFNINAPETREYKRVRAERMLNLASLPQVISAPIQALRFGECMLYAVPGEVYIEYGKYMKSNSPAKINLVAELANGGPACYIPSKIIFNTTSYESAPSSAPFVEETGQKMSEFAVELGKKIY